MSLSPEQEALIADRLRVWEVHRACQVATLAASDDTPSEDSQRADPGLDAILRCLLHELGGDIAAVTLLDQTTQYFLSVVRRSALHNPHLTDDARKWYGCQSISHHGGLCVQTITMQSDPLAESVFEIFDLSEGETRVLPVVDGTAASFRHYSGVPLITRKGTRLGTLFVFRDEPARQGLSRAHRHFMHVTAQQAVDQIYLSVQALESKRALRMNGAVLDFLNTTSVAQHIKSTDASELCSQVYHNAAKLLAHAFELDGVMVQELPGSTLDAGSKRARRERLLASWSQSIEPVPDSTAEQLLKSFPSGAVCHLLSEADGYGTFAASGPGDTKYSTTISVRLFQDSPAVEQLVFLPLLNTFHHRHTAFILGFATGSARVLSSRTDLLPLSAFGWTIMSEIRRIEEQILDRKKNDFLGSVSHEMRSPLHGLQACVDLAREERSHTQRIELLNSASSCALQLGDTIDNILRYSNIGSPSGKPHSHLRVASPRVDSTQISSQPLAEEENAPDPAVDIMNFIDDVVAKERSKSNSMTPSIERRKGSLPAFDLTWQTVVLFDSSPSSNIAITSQSDVGVIISNLLSNCLKFTGPVGCIRVSLDASIDSVKMSFLDTACGMSPDFVKHKLFAPFAQQDSLDPGIGLGLSFVNRAVQRLGGDITFHTDEAEGTEWSVILPRAHFSESTYIDVCRGHLSIDAVDFSMLNVQLMPPGRWKTEEGDRTRNQRCLDAFVSSLTRTLSTWCSVELKVYGEPWQVFGKQRNIVLVLHSDLENLRHVLGDAFDITEKIVFCPDREAEKHARTIAPGTYTTFLLGTVLPSKIIAALEEHVQKHQHKTTVATEMVVTSGIDSEEVLDDHHDAGEISTRVRAGGDAQGESVPCQPVAPETAMLPVRTTILHPQREPKLLLVDDNAINLKVLGMFAKKCSRRPAVSAGGGREAIELFKTGWNTLSGVEAFDIILLDLSMPEVSGFQVAATIRGLELHQAHQEFSRTYIVALTGLVSDRDRDAAFAAGVDDYVTKPASLSDLQNVMENWRNLRGLT